MKTTIQLGVLALITLAFSCCCGMKGSSCGSKKHTTVMKNVTVNNTNAKGGMSTTTKQVPVKVSCGKCGSYYCPKPECCGIISKEVLHRASAQGWTGDPFIGLIPTMKTLAPSKNNQ